MKKLFLALGLACIFAPQLKAQAHDAQINVTLASSCNSATPCYTEIYRVQVAGPTSLCPSSVSGYTLIASSLLGTTVTNNGETTVYDDQDSALQSGVSYCYAATVQYLTGLGGESPIGPSALATFPTAPARPTATTVSIKK